MKFRRSMPSRAVFAAALLISFGGLAGWVMGGGARSFDEGLLLALREPIDRADPLGPKWFEEAARDVTALGSNAILFFWTAAAAVFLSLTGRRRAAGLLLTSIVLASAINTALKLAFARPRPDLAPHGAAVYTMSFPSGHAFLSATVYLTLAAVLAQTQRDRRVRAFILSIAATMTLLIGASRVYLGVHWPTDVLAGWLLGVLWALLFWTLTIWLRQRGAIESGGGRGS